VIDNRWNAVNELPMRCAIDDDGAGGILGACMDMVCLRNEPAFLEFVPVSRRCWWCDSWIEDERASVLVKTVVIRGVG
jgi:hypothetical protein